MLDMATRNGVTLTTSPICMPVQIGDSVNALESERKKNYSSQSAGFPQQFESEFPHFGSYMLTYVPSCPDAVKLHSCKKRSGSRR